MSPLVFFPVWVILSLLSIIVTQRYLKRQTSVIEIVMLVIYWACWPLTLPLSFVFALAWCLNVLLMKQEVVTKKDDTF